ncbi:hypothetical protein TELCIR_15848 [Teladorsagia circumcincta]|uniref:WD domain, G-beta repeat protein n=1 Tax=Teladorsagia circumcincta TaxID=45464 RepID=A0A2G9TX36_TELCI|nr:hypothetical protein TELCIR_15848 [Teladorsagia circumcincta]
MMRWNCVQYIDELDTLVDRCGSCYDGIAYARLVCVRCMRITMRIVNVGALSRIYEDLTPKRTYIVMWAPGLDNARLSLGDDAQALIWDLQNMPRPVEDPILAYSAGGEHKDTFIIECAAEVSTRNFKCKVLVGFYALLLRRNSRSIKYTGQPRFPTGFQFAMRID